MSLQCSNSLTYCLLKQHLPPPLQVSHNTRSSVFLFTLKTVIFKRIILSHGNFKTFVSKLKDWFKFSREPQCSNWCWWACPCVFMVCQYPCYVKSAKEGVRFQIRFVTFWLIAARSEESKLWQILHLWLSSMCPGSSVSTTVQPPRVPRRQKYSAHSKIFSISKYQ